MTAGGLIVGALAALVAAAAFLQVGRTFWTREASDPAAQRAARLFALWWFAAGAYALFNGTLLNLLATSGEVPLRLGAAVRTLSQPLLAAGLVGLTYHLVYLLTGRPRALWLILAYFAGAYAVGTYVFALAQPVDVRIGALGTELVHANPPPRAQQVAVSLLALDPLVAASLAYIVVGLRLREIGQRRRALLVGLSLALWLGGVLLSNLLEDETVRFVARPVLGLAAALAVLLAYHERRPRIPRAEHLETLAERAQALV